MTDDPLTGEEWAVIAIPAVEAELERARYEALFMARSTAISQEERDRFARLAAGLTHVLDQCAAIDAEEDPDA